MSALGTAVREHALRNPERTALADHQQALNYRDLAARVVAASERLHDLDTHCLGLLADNGIPWALADLAAHIGGVPLVPLPLFFSPQQICHAIGDSGVDTLLTDQPDAIQALLAQSGIATRVLTRIESLTALRLTGSDRPLRTLPPGTAKVTYTSGTTGEPKGVCLSRAHMETVARSLIMATRANVDDHHLCLTPLSTLLENLGGVHAPLLAGASSHVLPLAQVGLSGATGLQVSRMLQALIDVGASSAILAPQMLSALLGAIERGAPAPTTLRFVAVGGAPVSPHLLQRALAAGLPVFEGYGLSECASVVALNAPGDVRPGSQGRPLPHARISIADDGEVLIEDGLFLGYLGQSAARSPWRTGDLGDIDADGFLHLRGRRKNLFITSFGRNVAPEWVESELTAQPAIAQAAVFGEARPFNVAVITPAAGTNHEQVAAAIAEANSRLPDYARVQQWLLANEAFSLVNQQMTANGRLRREAIHAIYQAPIESHYEEIVNDVF
jgi:long-chain acyl-CoA synthetase